MVRTRHTVTPRSLRTVPVTPQRCALLLSTQGAYRSGHAAVIVRFLPSNQRYVEELHSTQDGAGYGDDAE